MKYEFEVPGQIKGKGRPRVNSYTGMVYTPTTTKDYEYLVEQYFLLKYPKFKPLEGRVAVNITAMFGIPKSTKKQDIEKMLENSISPTKKPDIDNIVKIILDAMNKFAFKDDTQITKLGVEKIYGTEEKVTISIEEY
jgi:Holliday junction resolvase RusA-like endonuclease